MLNIHRKTTTKTVCFDGMRNFCNGPFIYKLMIARKNRDIFQLKERRFLLLLLSVLYGYIDGWKHVYSYTSIFIRVRTLFLLHTHSFPSLWLESCATSKILFCLTSGNGFFFGVCSQLEMMGRSYSVHVWTDINVFYVIVVIVDVVGMCCG